MNYQIDNNKRYTSALIKLSNLAADALVSKNNEYGWLHGLKGTKLLFKALPIRTKGMVQELTVKALLEPHFEEVLHTGGAAFHDLIALGKNLSLNIEVKHGSESAGGFTLIGGLKLESDSTHFIVMHPQGYYLGARDEYMPAKLAIIAPGILTKENTGYNKSLGHYVSIPSSPSSKSKYAFMLEYFTSISDAQTQFDKLA